jgi:Tol biopolymer transport system component
VLYEAATRQRPFSAESGFETMHRIVHDTPTPVEQLNPKVPAELRRLIRRCLAKNPEQRLQSMKDLAIELREIVEEYDTLSASASSGSLASGMAPAAGRRSTMPLWIGAGLVVLAGLALAWWGLRRGSAPGGPPQHMRVTTQTSRGDVTECALSPDGRYLAYLAGRAGRLSLRVRQVATGSDVEVLPPSDNTILFPSFSPDGNYLFYSAATPEKRNYRTLYQVPSLGGTPRRCGFDVDSRVSPSPDGARVAFWRFASEGLVSRLVVLDLASGQERILAALSPAERFQGAPDWSPDGRRIAALLFRPAPNLHSTVAIYDAVSGRRQDLVTLPFTTTASLAWLRDGTGLVSAGMDLRATTSAQVYLHTYPGGRTSRITNDFNWYDGLSASRSSETIAAQRTTEVDNVWMANAAGGPARRLTAVANPENSTFQSTPLDSGTVVTCAPADQYVQLWALGSGGGEPRQLTSGNAHYINPFSSGNRLFFTRTDSTGAHVWSSGTDGANPRQLTSGAGERVMDQSADGRMIAVVHFDDPGKYTVLASEDGHVVREWTGVAGGIGFSPDSRGMLIGFVNRDARGLSVDDWKVFPVAGGAPSATFRFPDPAIGGIWAPDGRSVTFRNRADPAWNVYRETIDGGAPVQLTHFTRGRVNEQHWSPDGTKLALNVLDGNGSNLWVTDAAGGHPVQVTQFATERIWRFRWMPDSRRLVVDAGVASSDAVLIHDFR